MIRWLVYLPEVTRDFADAFAYYEALSPKAALSFDAAFDRAEGEIETGMVTHQCVFEHYHRVFVGQFAYNLCYRLATCLSSLDNLIAAQSDRLAALQTHKQGLMQQLFPSPADAIA